MSYPLTAHKKWAISQKMLDYYFGEGWFDTKHTKEYILAKSFLVACFNASYFESDAFILFPSFLYGFLEDLRREDGDITVTKAQAEGIYTKHSEGLSFLKEQHLLKMITD